MPLTDDALGGLTSDEADLREAELRQSAEDDGVRLAIVRVPEPAGLLTLSWQLLSPLPSPAEAEAPAGVAAEIRRAAGRIGVDERILAAIAFVESSFKPKVSSATSSARGLFQFIDSTWNSLVGQFGAALDVKAGDRDNVRAQCLMGAKLLSLIVSGLQTKLGHRPTAGQCYAGHFLGLGAAAALIANDPREAADAALARFYGTAHLVAAAHVVQANRPIFFDQSTMRSTGSMLGVLDTKIQDGLQQAAMLFGMMPERAAEFPVPGDPAWLAVARAELARGIAEFPGSASNPRIEEYFTWTRLGAEPDGVAWCAAFTSFCLGMTNHLTRGTGSVRAADWIGFGDPLDAPKPGAIAVLEPLAPRSSGHVAFWLGTNGGTLRLLGGNQGDRVSIANFPAAKLRAFRFPTA